MTRAAGGHTLCADGEVSARDLPLPAALGWLSWVGRAGPDARAVVIDEGRCAGEDTCETLDRYRSHRCTIAYRTDADGSPAPVRVDRVQVDTTTTDPGW